MVTMSKSILRVSFSLAAAVRSWASSLARNLLLPIQEIRDRLWILIIFSLRCQALAMRR